jgi:murein DD-endopeptidase MepM/ murein hydrolase activator NlpD
MAISEANSMIGKLENLLTHPGLDSSVGPTPITRGMFAFKDVWGNKDAFLGYADQVISSKALSELISRKAEGATFGALSDTEMAILRSAATAIGAWENKNSKGKLTGFDVSEKAFKAEVEKLISEYKDLVEKAKDPLQLFSMAKPVSDVSVIKDFSKVSTLMGTGTATGITAGSSAWKYGFDLVLDGGKGAKVVSPFGGEVIMAKSDGGFGNSVKVRLDDGQVIRLSHLDSINVKPGQRIPAGFFVGTQGNTGNVIKVGAGGTGTHVDITIYDKNGKPLTSQMVASILNTRKV